MFPNESVQYENSYPSFSGMSISLRTIGSSKYFVSYCSSIIMVIKNPTDDLSKTAIIVVSLSTMISIDKMLPSVSVHSLNI